MIMHTALFNMRRSERARGRMEKTCGYKEVNHYDLHTMSSPHMLGDRVLLEREI